jgi:hypothetical protein
MEFLPNNNNNNNNNNTNGPTTKVRGFKPGRERWIFKGDKNPQHDFLRKGSKAVGPCRKVLRHVKCLLRYGRDTDKQYSAAICRPVYSTVILGVYATARAENSGG